MVCYTRLIPVNHESLGPLEFSYCFTEPTNLLILLVNLSPAIADILVDHGELLHMLAICLIYCCALLVYIYLLFG